MPATLTPITLRAKPVTVQAMQYTQANWRALDRWLAAELGRERFQFSPDGGHLLIETLEGDSRDCASDVGYWILMGTIGEFYPVLPEVVAAKYDFEPVRR